MRKRNAENLTNRDESFMELSQIVSHEERILSNSMRPCYAGMGWHARP
jgi:hypothetical protein